MIKRLIIFFLLFVGISLAQPFGKATKGFRIIKTNYSNSSGEKGSTKFFYNSNSFVYKSFWSLENGSRYSTNLYEHDENGNIISAYREFSDSLTSFEIFQYENGNKVLEKFSRSDGKNGSASDYYENGLQKSVTFQNHKGWLNGVVKYQYSENKKVSGKLFRDNNEIAIIDYKYDENRNLIEEYWDFSGKWNQKFIYVYENTNLQKTHYTSPYLKMPSNVRIKEEFYTYNNEKNGPSHYHYNDNGFLETKEFIRSDSVSTITKYEYDEQGKLIKSFRQYSDNRNAYFTYSYDENDNLVLRNFMVNDSLFGYEAYFFDSENKLYKAVLKSFDSWLSGEISYTYKPNGELEKGFFIGKDGFDAEIIFTYNDDLLKEVVWNFSFEKFQKYIFEYESF